jgi:N-acetylglucosamine-6-phosphate deacetylase
MIITADTVMAGGQTYAPGWLAIDGDRVRSAGSGLPPRPPDQSLGAVTVVPGFVDIHVHGGGGADLASADQSRRAAAFHRGHGTTTLLASLVTAAPDVLLAQVRALAELVDEGVVAGIHLEGPWLSARRRGAHVKDLLREPDAAELRRLVAASRGGIRMVTVAPELPGALDLIRTAVDLGIVVAVGHTDADFATAGAAFAAGARVATHLFNGMPPLHHREPGPVAAALDDERVSVEVVLDGRHLHPAVYRQVLAAAGAQRTVLVTDATAPAGMPDGDYALGATAVTVNGGVATVTGTDVIAGSTATSSELFARAVAWSRKPRQESMREAVWQTSRTPAAVFGWTDRDLSPGGRADLVVLDDQLRAEAVMRDGRWSSQPIRS